jgi:universal stress protein A
MPVYQRILTVIELSEDGRKLAHRAQVLANALGARLELLHVVEFVPVEPMNETLIPPVQMEAELVKGAVRELDALAGELGLAAEATRVEMGNVKAEIVRVARERGSDLIVVGSRERHGPSILFNLTEDTVLHAAPCDVLAMRIGRGR